MESSLECEVCFTDYNSKDQRPKFLPCGHSMCASCVTDTLRANKGIMNCPFCRTPCGTGVKTLDDFPTAFALLKLIDVGEQKGPSNALSKKEKDKKILQEKKKAEYDRTGDHISNCNEYQLKILQAKEAQESAIQNIRLRITKMLEEQNKLKEEEKNAASIKEQLDDIAAEGDDIVKGLEALQERVTSSSTLLGLNMVSQDVQRYHTASQNWVTSRVETTIEEQGKLTKEKNWCPSNIESLKEKVIGCNVEVWAFLERNNEVSSAQITMFEDNLLLKSLCKGPPPDISITIPYQQVKKLIDNTNVTVYLSVKLPESLQLDLVCIRLQGDADRTRQFRLMCSGECGPSYANTSFHEQETGRVPGIWGGARNDGELGALPGFKMGPRAATPIVEGLVASFYMYPVERRPTHFLIYTETVDTSEISPVGKVISGLPTLKKAQKVSSISSVRIMDCGIVLPA